MPGDSVVTLAPNSGGDKVLVIPIAGAPAEVPGGSSALPVSALRLADNSDIGTGNPLPVGVIGTVAVTQSGSWVSVGVTNARLDANLSTLATQTTAAAILSALGGTLTVAFTAGQPASPLYSYIFDGSNILGTNAHPVIMSGTVTANLGTLNGAATAAAQATGNASLASIDGKIVAVNTGAVVVTTLPAVTFAAPQHVIVDSATLGTVTISGAVTQSGTWTVGLSAGSNTIGKVDQGAGGVSAWKVDGSAVTQPVSGTVAVTQSTSPWVTSAAQSGTWTVVQGAPGVSAWPVSLASLPALSAGSAVIGHVVVDSAAGVVVTSSALPSGASTSALQSSTVTLLGAGLPSSIGAHGALAIEGVASGTAIPVSGSVTASGTVTANQGTGGSSAWKVDGSAVTQPMSAAALPLPTGASTSALQGAGLPAAFGAGGGVKIDGSGTALPVSGTVALSAGSAVVGHVIADSGSTTAVTSLPAIPTGSNTIGAVTAPGAAALALDATLTSGSQIAQMKGGAKGATAAALVTSTASGADHQGQDVIVYDASGNVVSLATSTLQTTGNTSLSTLAGTVTSSRVAVNPPTTAALAASVRLTPDGSNLNSATAGIPMILTDNTGTYVGTKTGQLPTSLGQQTAAASVSTVSGTPTVSSATSLATTGIALKGSAGTAYWIEVSNASAGTIFIQIHDTTTTPSNAAKPLYWSPSGILTLTSSTVTIGHTVLGGPCGTGIFLIASSTGPTYTALIVSTIAYTAQII